MEISEKRPRRWLGGKVYLSVYIVSAVIILVIGFFLLGYYFEIVHYRKNYDFENPVKAVYVDVHRSCTDAEHGIYWYAPVYEYTAPDGTYYSGTYERYRTESEAESYLGQEVDIYINGKGGSTPNDYRKNRKVLVLVFSIIFLSIGIPFVIIFVIPHRWKPPKPTKPTSLP